MKHIYTILFSLVFIPVVFATMKVDGIDKRVNTVDEKLLAVPNITELEWLDNNPMDGNIDQVRLTFSEAVNFSDIDGAGNIGLDIFDIAFDPSPDYSSAPYVNVLTVVLDLVTPISGTSLPGTTLSYTPAANSSIVSVSDASEMITGEVVANGGLYLDAAAPFLLSSTPSDNATGVAIEDNIVLNFSEIVQAGTGNIQISGTGGATYNVSPTASQLTFGMSITINPSADLTNATAYDILIDATAVTDGTNTFAGLVAGELNFTTVALAPIITNAIWLDNNPPDGSIDRLQLIFNENVNIVDSDLSGFNAITATGFTILNQDYSGINRPSLTLNISPILGTSIPTATISYSNVNASEIVSFASGLEILNNANPGVVLDGAPPRLISSTPADDSGGFPIENNIVLNFSETVQAGSGNIQISGTGGATYDVTTATELSFGSSITIDPGSNLNNLTPYNILVASSAVSDGANTFTGLIAGDLNFTTIAVPPVITNVTWLDNNPVDGSIDQVQLTFDVAVDFSDLDGAGGTGLDIFNVVFDATPDYSTAPYTNVTTVTLDLVTPIVGTGLPTTTLSYSSAASNSSIIRNGDFSEVQDGDIATHGGTYTDGAAPFLLSSNPSDNDIEVLTTADIVLNFSETVQAGTGNIQISGTGGATYDVATATELTFGTSITIDPVSNLANSTAYDVLVDATAVSDGTNAFLGLVASQLNFTTIANPPVITNATWLDANPADGSIDQLQLTFDVAVDFLDADGAAGVGLDVFDIIFDNSPDYSSAPYTNVTVVTLDLATPIAGTALPATTLSYSSAATNATILVNGGASEVQDGEVAANGGTYTDGAAPFLLSSSPTDEEANVLIDENIALNFSETVQAGTGNIQISGTGGAIYDVATATELSFGSTVTIDPVSDLANNTPYNVLVDATAVTDGSNSFSGLVAGALNFTTIVSAPTITSAIWLDNNPRDGSIDGLQLIFSENIDVVDADGSGFNAITATGFTIVEQNYSATNQPSITLEITPISGTSSPTGTSIVYSNSNASEITSNSSGLEIPNLSTPGSVTDGAAPAIINTVLNAGNSFLDVTFSEDIFTADASSVVLASDFNLTFDDGSDGSISAVSISSITDDSDNSLSGGVSLVRFNLSITGTPENADDIIEISPNLNRVKDALDNAMDISATTGSISLFDDVTGPTFLASTANATNTQIDINFSANVAQSNGNDLRLRNDRELFFTFDDNGNGLTIGSTGLSKVGPGNIYSFTFTISGGVPDGTESITFFPTDGAEIFSNPGGIAMSGTETLVVNLSDQLSPTFVNSTYYDVDENGSIDEVVIELSEPIDDSTIDPNDFSINGNSAIGILSGLSSTNGLDLDVANDNIFTLSFNIQGTGGFSVDFASDASAPLLSDLAGNEVDDISISTNNDEAAPIILSATTDDTPTEDGEIDQIVVVFSENIDVSSVGTDGSDFTITSPVYTISAASATGTNVTIDLTPSGSLDVNVTPTVTLLNGGVSDASGNTTILGNKSITSIDGAQPFFVSLAANDPNGYIDGEILSLDINMGESGLALTVDLTDLNASLSSAAAMTDDGDNTYSFSTFISSAMNAGVRTLPITARDSELNASTNNSLTITTDFIAPIVAITPTFTSDRTPGLSGTVNDNDAVISLTIDGNTYSPTNNMDGTWTLADDIVPTLADNTTFSVTVTATDLAGNIGTDATNGEVKIDNTAPEILSIVRNTPLISSTNASAVVFRVTFSEGVTGVDAADFTAAFSGTSTDVPVVSHVSSGRIYDLGINNIVGSGVLGIDISGAVAISDSTSNAFGGVVTSEQSYTIDQTAPKILSVVRKDDNPTSSSTVNFRVTFSEPVSNVSADGSDFSVVVTDAASSTGISVVSISSTIYDVALTGIMGTGTITIEASGVQDIIDSNDNNWDNTIDDFEVYNTDFTAPTANNVSTSIIGLSTTITVDMNEVGTVYYAVFADGVAPSTGNEVRNGTGALVFGSFAVTSAGSNFNGILALLQSRTDYDLFLALEDQASPTRNISLEPKIDILSGGVTVTSGTLTSDLCLGGPSGSLSAITIAEGINNDFREGTNLRLRLNLPIGFEFDQTASIATTGSTLTDISNVSFDYPAANVLRVEYDVDGTPGAILDELVITGIEIKAIGSTAYASADIERGGGTAIIFGAEGIDNPILGVVSSVARPNGPVFTENSAGTVTALLGDTESNVAMYTSNRINTEGGVNNVTPITITPDGFNTSYTINIYTDAALTNNIYTNTGSSSYSPNLNDFGLTETTYGVHSFYITQVAADGCESNGVIYSIAITQFSLSPNTAVFTETDTEGTMISAAHAGTASLISFSGNGLTNVTTTGASPATADFIPSAAGAVNSPHTIVFRLSNALSGAVANYELNFRVNAEANIFGADNTFDIFSGNVNDCIESTNTTLSITNPDPTGNNANGIPDFYELRFFAYKNDAVGAEVTSDIKVSGTVGTIGPLTISEDNTPGNSSNWVFDPSNYTLGDGGIDTIAVALFVIDELTDVISRSSQGLIYLYPLPEVSLTNVGVINDTEYFSEDDDAFTIQADIRSIDGELTGNINSNEGYILLKDTDENGSYETQIADLRTISAVFSPRDPDGDGIETEDETGLYRIVYETASLTDANCTNSAFADFEILSMPDSPEIDITGLSANTDGLTASEYLIEYCGGDLVLDLSSIPDAANLDESFNWYTNSTLTASVNATNISGSKNETIDIAAALFAGVEQPTTRQTKELWLTVSDHVGINGSNYEGSESDPIHIIIQVFPEPDVPVLTGDFPSIATSTNETNKAQVVSSYLFEYCIPEGGSASIETIELQGNSLNTEVDVLTGENYASESYFSIIDNSNTSVRESQVSTITATDLNGLLGFSGAAGTLRFKVIQTNYDNNFPTDIGSAFDGCSSNEREFEIRIFEIPDAPDAENFNGFNNGGVVEYYSCSGESLATILTPQETGASYSWYEDNSGTPSTTRLTVASFNDNFVIESELTGFNRSVVTETTYTYWVTQTTNINGGSGFLGCESDFTQVNITVYPDPTTPDLTINNNVVVDNEITYCEGGLADVSFEVSNVTPNAVLRWYSANINEEIENNTPVFITQADASGENIVSAEDLRLLRALEANGVNYFLVSQQNDSIQSGSSVVFTGCETEESEMLFVTINIFDIPLAPTTTAGKRLFGEDEVDDNNITVQGEGNVGEVFRWYEDFDENGIVDSTVPVFTGPTATSADLGLAGNEGNRRYKFLISQTQDIGNGTTVFEGCESPFLDIFIFEVPPAPTATNPSPQCDVDVTNNSTLVSHVGIQNNFATSSFMWYDEDGVFQRKSSSTSPQVTRNENIDISDIVEDGFIGDTTVFVSQLINDGSITGEIFNGTESDRTAVTITVYPQPDSPTVPGNGSVMNEYDFCEQIVAPADELISIINPDPAAQYIWYPNADLDSDEVIATATFITLDQLNGKTIEGGEFSTARNIEFEDGYSIYVTELNSIIGGFAGCESEPTEVRIFVQPKAESVVFGDLVLDEEIVDGEEYCYDYGDISLGSVVTIDGSDIQVTDGTYTISSGGLIDNGDGTASLNTQDMAAAVAVPTGREGSITKHDITYSYTSEWGCVETFTKSIFINPQPTLDLQYLESTGQYDAGTSLDMTGVCFDQGNFTITGFQSTGDATTGVNATSGIFTLFFGDVSDNVIINAGVSLPNPGRVRINSSEIAAAPEVGGTSDGVPLTFNLKYDFTDVKGCSNSITQAFIVEPKPTLDIILPAEVCVDASPFTINATHISGAATVATDAQFGSFKMGRTSSLQSGIQRVSQELSAGFTDNGDGTAVIDPSLIPEYDVTGTPVTFFVEFEYQDLNTVGTGSQCSNVIVESITINPLPRLDIIMDSEVCFDDVIASGSYQGRRESGAAEGLMNASSGTFEVFLNAAATVAANNTSLGFIDNGNVDGTFDLNPALLATDNGGTRTGDDITFYVKFTYQDDQSTTCTNSIVKPIVIHPQPNISFSIQSNGQERLGTALSDDQFYISVGSPNVNLVTFDLDAGEPFTGGNFSGAGVGIRTGNIAPFDPNGTDGSGAKLDLYSAPEDYEINFTYTDNETCQNDISKTITVLPVPEFYDYDEGAAAVARNILNVQACKSQAIVQQVVISNLPALGVTINDIDFTWRANSDIRTDSLEVDFSDLVTLQAVNDSTMQISFINAQSDDFRDDGPNANFPRLEGNVIFTVTAQYTFDTGFDQGDVKPFSISRSEIINIGDTPQPKFRWDSTTVNNVTKFFLDDLNDSPVDINDIAFEVFDASGPSLVRIDSLGRNISSPLYDPSNIKLDWSYDFNNPNAFGAGEYAVLVTYNSTSSCKSEELRYVTISESTALAEGTSLTFDFEDGLQGWYVDSVDYISNQFNKAGFDAYDPARSVALPSWELGSANTLGNGNTSDFWITNVDGSYNPNEVSTVFSPTFDLSNLRLPTISFRYSSDLDLRDGVVLQYSTDDGVTWNVLGTYDNVEGTSGKNWFNTLGLNGNPGNHDDLTNGDSFNPSFFGWNLQGKAPGVVGVNTPEWRTAAHKLDDIPLNELAEIRFRFSLGASAGIKDRAGFAFDDFKIYDREKFIVVEQFSSLANSFSIKSDSTIYGLLESALSNDALLINYYTALVDEPDPLNRRNRNDPGARSAYYGISEVPRTVIAGSKQEPTRAPNINNDFVPLQDMGWNENKFNEIALDEALFDIGDITISGSNQEIIINVSNFTSLVDLNDPNTELSFRFAVVETVITGQDINAQFGVDTIFNALRKMLPSAAGFNHVGAVASGFSDFGIDFTAKWNIRDIYDANNLKVIVFVQLDTDVDPNSGLSKGVILQAKEAVISGKIIPNSENITANEGLSNFDISIYPNPADQLFEVLLSRDAEEDMEWALFDQTGRRLLEGNITKGNNRAIIPSADLPGGIYMLSLYSDTKQWKPKRIIVVH